MHLIQIPQSLKISLKTKWWLNILTTIPRSDSPAAAAVSSSFGLTTNCCCVEQCVTFYICFSLTVSSFIFSTFVKFNPRPCDYIRTNSVGVELLPPGLLTWLFFGLLRFFRLPTSSSRLLILLVQVSYLSLCLPVWHLHTSTVDVILSHWVACLSPCQVTGSWSALWTAWTMTPGSIMPSVTLSVCCVTTSPQDSDLRHTSGTLKSSAHRTTPDWTLWNMERWDKPSVCL